MKQCESGRDETRPRGDRKPCCACAAGPVRTVARSPSCDRHGPAARCCAQALVRARRGANCRRSDRGSHDTAGIWPLAGVALIFEHCRGGPSSSRGDTQWRAPRWVWRPTSRQELFAHLQRLPVAFQRPMAVRSVAVTRDYRSVDDPAVRRLRLRLLDREFDHRHRRA